MRGTSIRGPTGEVSPDLGRSGRGDGPAWASRSSGSFPPLFDDPLPDGGRSVAHSSRRVAATTAAAATSATTNQPPPRMLSPKTSTPQNTDASGFISVNPGCEATSRPACSALCSRKNDAGPITTAA
jgi:hypothetical protein